VAGGGAVNESRERESTEQERVEEEAEAVRMKEAEA
jgi:hypothetical protein